jgi:putative ABC transport system permease protein
MIRARAVPLALKILVHAPRRLVVSLAGVVLAVVLMFSQVGFRDAMFDSQTEVIKRLNGDLFIVNRLKRVMHVPGGFTSRRLYQARAVTGVAAVYPLYIESAASIWKDPVARRARPIRVLAFDPLDPVFDFSDRAGGAEALKRPGTVLFDRKSRDYYGQPRVGTQTELAGREVRVVGTFSLGVDFFTDGNVIMSDRDFKAFFPELAVPTPHLEKVEIGVIRLADGANPSDVRAALENALTDEVEVLTKLEFIDREVTYWRDNTAIGYIFGLGMGAGIAIGVVVCYQILYTNVNNYLPQFATLKAMGFTNPYLVGIVLQQAVFVAVLGFVPALVAATGLFRIVGGLSGLVMNLALGRVAEILILTVAMCLFSATFAMWRVLTADPAEVFR